MRGAIGVGCGLLACATAHAEPTPICTDRPAKANAVCTVAPGHVQLENSLVGWARFKAAGSSATTLTVGSSVLKYGLTDHSDLQLGWTPYIRIVIWDKGSSESIGGIGDVSLRSKHRLSRAEAPVQVALIPFAKLPTAKRGIGNRRFEGGLAMPISFSLVGPVTATLGPELDLLADGDGHGTHVGLVNIINLSAPVAPRLTLAVELWTNSNIDPAGTVKQASADVALAYALANDFQLDAGINGGLTRATPDLELYVGLSIRR